MQASESTWWIERRHDGGVDIAARAPTLAGAARLEFADGSFVDADPFDTALIAIHARPTPTGDWLLRTAVGDAFVRDLKADVVPVRCRADAPAATSRRPDLLRGAQIAHLAAHDDIRRFSLWYAELLAGLASLVHNSDDGPADLPIGYPNDLAATIDEALSRASTRQELTAELERLAELIASFELVPRLDRDAIRTTIVRRRAEARDADEVLAEREREFPKRSILDERAPVPIGAWDLDDVLLGADVVAARDARRAKPEVLDAAHAPDVELAIDRGRAPAGLDFSPDAHVVIQAFADRVEITIRF